VSLPELPIAEESSITVTFRVGCEELSVARASSLPRLWIRQILQCMVVVMMVMMVMLVSVIIIISTRTHLAV